MRMDGEKFDVVIVGCGPVGSYLAWRLAERGRSVCAIDRGSQSRQGSHIGVFHFEEEARRRLLIPPPPAAEVVCVYRDMTLRPPLGGKPLVVENVVTLALRLPLFLSRIQRYARRAGADLKFNRRFVEVLFDTGGRPAGVRVEHGPRTEELRSRIVVDATGLTGAVREGLPPDSFTGHGPPGEDGSLQVYMEYWEDIRGTHPQGLTSFPECNGWWAPFGGDKAIVGVGHAGAPQEAIQIHLGFTRTYFDLPHRVERTVLGRIPYRRPPDSMVDDGVMVIGDAAAQNKPFNGEGISSAYLACQIAAQVIDEALSAGDVTAASLWKYNTRYYRGQGATFAALTAFAPTLVSLEEDECACLFASGLLDPGELQRLFARHEIASKSPASTARAALRLARRPALLRKLGAAALGAALLAAIYRHYPETPAGLSLWRPLAAAAWRGRDRIRPPRRASRGTGSPT